MLFRSLGGKIDFVLHFIGMSPNVRKCRTYARFRSEVSSSRSMGCAVQMTEQQRQVLYMAASVLLDYPDEHLAEKIAAVESQLDMLSLPIQAELAAFLDAVRVLGPRGIEEHYVET